jgi:hypothetical protein
MWKIKDGQSKMRNKRKTSDWKEFYKYVFFANIESHSLEAQWYTEALFFCGLLAWPRRPKIQLSKYLHQEENTCFQLYTSLCAVIINSCTSNLKQRFLAFWGSWKAIFLVWFLPLLTRFHFSLILFIYPIHCNAILLYWTSTVCLIQFAQATGLRTKKSMLFFLLNKGFTHGV